MMIFDLFKNGSLSNVLTNVRKGTSKVIFDNTIRQIILIGIARGMMLIHQHRIIHHDLKLGNVLIDDNYYPHFTDFGMLQCFENYEPMMSTSGDFGSPAYMAPEVIEGETYTTKADVYSFGILMFEVITDIIPYHNIRSSYQLRLKVVNDGLRPEFSTPVKPALKLLIEKCWSPLQDKRPTFKEIFNKLAFGKDIVIDDDDDDERYFLDGVDKEAINDYVKFITSDDANDFAPQQQDHEKKVSHIIKKESNDVKIEKLENELMKMKNMFDEFEKMTKKKLLLMDDRF